MMLARGWRIAAATAALFSSPALAQTWSECNPLTTTTCPANTALGMSINVDFTQGEVNSFVASGGTPTYGEDGVTFTVAKSGDAPQLASVFYIMFGRVEVTMKPAPGAGIVSSLVLLSDTLDEIDMEWLGTDDSEVQTNYFSKGETTTYNRGQFNPAPNNQADFITYTIDWTSERIVWYVGGTVVRTLAYADADGYPQTPMQVKFGAWAGGDPSNPPGTIDWARGPTDYSQGPFSMVVRSAAVTDYSTGKKYTYSDTSGTWQSIDSEGGEINGNLGGAGTVVATASAPAATNSISPTIPPGGIIGGSTTDGANSPTRTVGAIPDGWVMTSEGKIVPIGGSSTTPPGQSPSSSGPPSSPSQGSGAETTLTTSTLPPGTATPATPTDGDGGNGVPTAAPGINGAGTARQGLARLLFAAVFASCGRLFLF